VERDYEVDIYAERDKRRRRNYLVENGSQIFNLEEVWRIYFNVSSLSRTK
jgi:hypothetical protein